MKITLVAAAMSLAALNGCAMAYGGNATALGTIYSGYKSPGQVGAAADSKTGEACISSILGIVATGDASIEAAKKAGVSKSNVGGWHSANDFLRWEGPEPGQLFQRIAGAVKDFAAVERKVDAATLELSVTAEAWANVSRAGNYAKPHVHPNSNLSG